MSENPAYFAIIPSAVRYCKNISANEKLMYGEITALTQKEGYCWATNKYFSELYGVSKRTVSRWINSLVKHGFIENDVTFINGTSMVDKRYMRLKGMDKNVYTPHDKNVYTPHDKNVHTLGTKMSNSNSTSLNNTSTNTPEGDECEKKPRKAEEDEAFEEFFENLWINWLRKGKKQEARRILKKIPKTKWDDIREGARRYARLIIAKHGTWDTQYKMGLEVFLNPAKKQWLEEWRIPGDVGGGR